MADEGPRAIVDRFLRLQRAMYAGGDVAPLEQLLADDIVWHVPGTSPIAGDHRGREAVLRYFRLRRRIAGGTMRIVERGALEGEDLLVQLADGTATIGGRQETWSTAGLYRVADGRLTEAWLVPADLEAFDRIWNGGPPPGAGRRRALSPGRALKAVAAGHTAWGLVAYRDPLREIVRAGIARSVGDGLFDREHADDARAAAFWFMLAGPLAGLAGHLVEAAERAGDRRALAAAGAAVTSVSVAGATVMPRSGFWAGSAIGVWLLHSARRRAEP